ncbi:MAG TPA: retropepsin-like aspartic protease [Nitrospira sp.]|nr:retropepsin-like aspartic protease [Nitrospira sp.]
MVLILFLSLAIVWVSSAPVSHSSNYVQWTDESGMVHFSDSLQSVPEKYRGQVKQERFKEDKPIDTAHPKVDCGAPAGSQARIFDRMRDTWEGKRKLGIFEVPFQAYEGTAQRVIVSVTLNGFVTVPMVIDTGAPGLLISPKVAQTLGLARNEEGKALSVASGIGGRTLTVRTFIEKVQVGGATDYFIPATIAAVNSSSYEGLIGMDFMSKYSLKIDPVKQLVVFEEVAPDLASPGGRSERWWRSLFSEFHNLRDAWTKASGARNITRQQRELAGSQVKEVDKLLCKLGRHADDYAVPQEWR